ncbi:MAG: adenine phosphoribosyltransferase [Bacteroidota bacterium]
MQKQIIDLKSEIRDVPDFPKKGIIFKDLTTAFKKPEVFNYIVDSIYDKYKDSGVTKVVSIESRGFIVGSILAYKFNAGFIPVRKPGKLPADTYKQSYDLEYGTDTLEIHKDALCENDVVLIHDDLLATGGTALATINLIKHFDIKSFSVCFICELEFLKGRERLSDLTEIFSLVKF